MNEVELDHSLACDSHERGRDFLTVSEIQMLLEGSKKGRYPIRDQAIIMLLYRHGLRESELCNIRLNDLDLKAGMLWVRRLKNGLSAQHPVTGDEMRLLRRYLAERKNESSPWLFLSERGGPLGRHTIIYLVKKAAQKAGLLFRVTPHMLRHSCGYYLANKGYDSRLIQDYLGHRDPKHTTRYTRTAGHRFERMWE
ncbi:Tyrosine recombinase XerC (plasmid) [Piscirickettsia salmonis]|uniref:tyrosine-type recombinase/integrase n=1 Tax=Piscirickettsia salmonis TaxID=1238 RepID=UPI0012BA9CF6|nr:tyrosine-type recombinase/integrase [Piscirickettsia salmonis]QGP56935.1 Tyrosine recombinase XerC [Piscirickettsia salmonis]QGP61617.1 Tyrosine recombinase XerC [Piscirickettsia salmonis]QGP66479.1 Tyrosine recombinase XerC [Piscirickettsia salmonis]